VCVPGRRFPIWYFFFPLSPKLYLPCQCSSNLCFKKTPVCFCPFEHSLPFLPSFHCHWDSNADFICHPHPFVSHAIHPLFSVFFLLTPLSQLVPPIPIRTPAILMSFFPLSKNKVKNQNSKTPPSPFTPAANVEE